MAIKYLLFHFIALCVSVSESWKPRLWLCVFYVRVRVRMHVCTCVFQGRREKTKVLLCEGENKEEEEVRKTFDRTHTKRDVLLVLADFNLRCTEKWDSCIPDRCKCWASDIREDARPCGNARVFTPLFLFAQCELLYTDNSGFTIQHHVSFF